MKKIFLLSIILSLFLNARTWQEIKQSGVLNAGVRDTPILVYRPGNTENPGFAYEMLKDFAKYHNLKLKIHTISSFGEYWKKDNINLNKTKEIAVPDIYEKIDLAAEIFTVTKRREELVKMTPYINTVELLFGTKNNKSRKLDDLIGKTILTYEAMIFSKLLQKEFQRKNIPFIIKYLNSVDGKIIFPKKDTINKKAVNLYLIPIGIKEKNLSYEPIAIKHVDMSINDAIAVILKIFENTYYREKLRPLFRLQDKKSQLAWASEYKNKELNKKIEEFFNYDKKTGNFSKRLKKYIGMDLEEYNKLINVID